MPRKSIPLIILPENFTAEDIKKAITPSIAKALLQDHKTSETALFATTKVLPPKGSTRGASAKKTAAKGVPPKP